MKGIINSSIADDPNAFIADRMFIIQISVKDEIPTFVGVLELIKHWVVLCFDLYKSPSVKDIKGESRADENTEKHFTSGLHQRIPIDFNELLKTSFFNCQLLRSLCKGYEDPVYGVMLGKKAFCCTIDNQCKKFYGEDAVLKFKEIYDLCGYHL